MKIYNSLNTISLNPFPVDFLLMGGNINATKSIFVEYASFLSDKTGFII